MKHSDPQSVVTAKNVDLSNCDREQIQYPGSIQPHGAMITLAEPEFRILQASVNAAELLGIPAEDLLGADVGLLFSKAEVETLRARLSAEKLEGAPVHLVRRKFADHEFDVLAHRFDGVLFLEFEARPQGADTPILDLYSELQVSISKLGATTSLQSFLDLAVQQVSRFTGFDRVLAYKFMEDGSGWVRAEAVKTGLESFLDLHYPASDIPAPARRMFALTWVRHQPDTSYKPVQMVPENNPATGNPLDMSYAFLRSVSVMYVDYLKNMGTQSAMVMTLMKDGKLWGLISCQHCSGPKHVPYEVRVASEFLAHMVSLLMSAKENAEQYEYQMKLQATGDMLVANVARVGDFAAGFAGGSPDLLDFIHSSGAAIVVKGGSTRIGMTPTENQIATIIRWLSREMEHEIFSTDCLSAYLPEATGFADVCAGLLALRFSKASNDYLLWFRPETVQTVNWAGDPSKPVDISDDGQRLMPRTSFALWKESVRLKSQPWQEVEINAAKTLRASLLELVLQRSEKLGKLYEELELSHTELDSFAHVAAHDLKEPLRGIHTYAQILQLELSGKLEPDAASKLDTMIRLSKRMDDLLNSLLNYSRLGRSITPVQCDLNAPVKIALDTLEARIQQSGTTVRIPRPLPMVLGDSERLPEVFENLIANAIKYNDKPNKEIEIGYNERAPDGQVIFYVKDNGIGVEERHYEKIFQIFHRLHGREDFGGGSGAGLAIVRKIIERHGGRIWVESKPAEETIFYFTLSPGHVAAVAN